MPRSPTQSRTHRRAGRQATLRLLGVVAERDLFGAPRDDFQLAQLVSQVASRSATPYRVLLAHLLGAAPRMSEPKARELWLALVGHRRKMWTELRRPVLLRVAALDYLSQRRVDKVDRVTLVSSGTLASAVRALATDSLTGLATRDHFQLLLEHELRKRWKRPPIVVFLDLDAFKRVNDEHGHPAGDALLAAVGRAWHESARSGDVLARVGGDEFAALFLEATVADVRRALTRVVRVVRAVRGQPLEAAAGFAWSVGIAAARPDDDADAIVARADRVMFADKRRRARPRTTPPLPPRPTVLYVSREPARVLALHRELAARGIVLVPVSEPRHARALARLARPQAIFADASIDVRGGGPALLRTLEAPVPKVVVLPAGWPVAGAGSTKWPTLRLPLDVAALGRVFPTARRRRSAVPPLVDEAAASALMRAIACHLEGRTAPPRVRALAADRLEVDLVRRLLGR